MSSPSDRMRLKDKIISNIAKAIKAIQEYQFYSGQESSILLTNSDWQCHKLCENLDHALLHGLRHVTHGYWRMVNEFTRKGAIKEIERIQNVTTDLGRGRAWIFMALNENLLESYLKCITDNSKFVKKFYVKEALVLDDQRMNLLITLTSGLEMASFQLDYDVPYLDLSAYPPRSRSMSNERPKDEDKVSIHSMESIASRRSVSGVEENAYKSPKEDVYSIDLKPLQTLASTPESNRAVMTDSDSSSIASLDTNSGFMDRSQTGTLSVDSGCHVDTNSLMSKRTTPTPGDNVSTSSQGSGSEVEPRLRRIEAIISVNEDVEEIEYGLEVIRVKSKGPKSKSKKSKRSSKVVDIAPMENDAKTFSMDIASSPNIEFLEASILNSFKEVFDEDNNAVGHSENNQDVDDMSAENSSQSTRSSNHANVSNTKDAVNVRNSPNMEQSRGDNSSPCHVLNNRVVSPVSNRDSNIVPDKPANQIIPVQDDSSNPICDRQTEIPAFDTSDNNNDLSHFKRKIESNSSFEELALAHENKKHHHVETSPRIETPPSESLDSAIVFSSKPSERHASEDTSATDEKYFVGLHEDEDFYKVRRMETTSDSPTDHSAKRQDYVDFILGQSEESEKMDESSEHHESSLLEINQLECKEEDYSIQLDNNILLFLMLEIFSDHDEQFEKMFGTSQGHAEGELTTVFLLISNRALYLLHQQESDHKFVKDSDIPFKDIDFLALSVNNQIINIVCTNRRKQFWLTTANETLTRAITSCLATAMEHCEFSIPKLTVLTDATTQKICMKKYAAKESRLEPGDITVEGYSLVYWEDPHSRMGKIENANREGTLLFRSSDTTKGQTWRPVYVILRGGMLCVFNDKNDSKPQCFVRLGGDQCVGCRICTSTDREHCIEIILSRGAPWQFAAANHIEVADWLQSLCKAVSEGTLMGDDIWSYLPCCTVLTHQKILLCHEDVQTSFFRTLGSANMEEVTGITVDSEVKNYCILEFESQEVSVSSEQWVLYFNSGSEMIKFTKAMSKCWEQQFQVEIPINTIDDPPVQARCQETAQHILKLFSMK